MKTLEEILAEYDYQFDSAQIATEPAEPRDIRRKFWVVLELWLNHVIFNILWTTRNLTE